MPYKSGKIIIAKTSFDKRVKLTDDDKKLIRKLRAEENLSQRVLARQFNVSRRLIQYVLDPEKLAENIRKRNERGGSKQYYDKEKHREYMKEHRRYKQNLYIKGKIEMGTTYSKQQFEGFTHRFIVKLRIDNDWRNDTNVTIYSNSDSYQKLEDFITEKKSDKVVSFNIEHRASKEQDEMASKLIDETLNNI